jgi:quinol monooxygenase YgiN
MAYLLPPSSSDASKSQTERISPGPPELTLGQFKGGWLTRPNEGVRTVSQPILFSKFTVQKGKRAEVVAALLNGLSNIDKTEPKTLSIFVVEDEANEDVAFVMERFADKEGLDAHMGNPDAKGVLSVVGPLIKSREGGVFKFVAGFISKDEVLEDEVGRHHHHHHHHHHQGHHHHHEE